MISAGIDLGGSKIETALFDRDMSRLDTRRVKTPGDSYEALLRALAGEIGWVRDVAGKPDLPVGIGMPGLLDPRTGVSVTANLPASGHRLAPDLMARAGGRIVTVNDCKAFALSEANGGAGREYRRVFGLIMGTGIGGGFCRDGQLDPGANGLVGEVGHFALPAPIVQAHDLPVLRCGCGRSGCFETLVSGPGLARLAQHLTGQGVEPSDIGQAVTQGTTPIARVFEIWLRLAAELLHTVQLHLDPDCIILGGGVSQIPDLDRRLAAALADALLPTVRAPDILKAKFGDSSGVRGAAMLAARSAEIRP